MKDIAAAIRVIDPRYRDIPINHDDIKQKEVVMLMVQVNYQRKFFSKMLALDADSNDDEARV